MAENSIQPVIDDRQPIFTIATKPRETIQFLLKNRKFSYFIFVGIVGSFASAISGLIGSNLEPKFTLGDVVYSNIVSSVALFFLTTALTAILLVIFGKTFGGQGKFKDMFRVMSMTMVPYIWVLPIFLFWMQLAPETFFVLKNVEETVGIVMGQFAGICLFLVMTVWSIIISLVGISVVHKMTKWKAFFTYILSLVAVACLGLVILMATGVQLF